MGDTSFGEKLNYLKSLFHVTDGEIGDGVNMTTSQVCRWRNGERNLDRYKDGNTAERLASFFIERAVLRRQRPRLAKLLSLSEADVESKNITCVNALLDFLYNGESINDEPIADEKPAAGANDHRGSFIGVRGVIDALLSMEEKITHKSGAEISVYLSLEYSRLLQDEAVSEILALLYRMNRYRPVWVFFDSWQDDAEKATRNLKALLPFVQTGKIQLNLVVSTQKFFYYNLTFFTKGIGMVITTEPAGGVGVSISILTESKDYIAGMGAVFADIGRISKTIAKYIEPDSLKEGASYFARLFETTGDIRARYDGINLLYLDEADYLKLLKINGVTGSRRGYRHDKFIKDKRRFDLFLEQNRVKEIVSLYGIELMIRENKVNSPDLSFIDKEIKADNTILRGLISGLLRYMEKYKNLSVFLEYAAGGGCEFSCRIKGDAFVLLHTRQNSKTHAIYSDNWMLVYEYIKQFQDILQSGGLINTKDAVRSALQMRLDNIQ